MPSQRYQDGCGCLSIVARVFRLIRVLSMMEQTLAGAGALTGLVLHGFIFIHGDWTARAASVVRGHVLSAVFMVAMITVFSQAEISTALKKSVVALFNYCAALLTSIAVYRSLLHPLSRAGRFPGPPWTRLAKLWHVWQCRDSKNHLVFDDLHRQYGDFVRTGTRRSKERQATILTARRRTQ